jgi:hypothetical protein
MKSILKNVGKQTLEFRINLDSNSLKQLIFRGGFQGLNPDPMGTPMSSNLEDEIIKGGGQLVCARSRWKEAVFFGDPLILEIPASGLHIDFDQLEDEATPCFTCRWWHHWSHLYPLMQLLPTPYIIKTTRVPNPTTPLSFSVNPGTDESANIWVDLDSIYLHSPSTRW